MFHKSIDARKAKKFNRFLEKNEVRVVCLTFMSYFCRQKENL